MNGPEKIKASAEQYFDEYCGRVWLELGGYFRLLEIPQYKDKEGLPKKIENSWREFFNRVAVFREKIKVGEIETVIDAAKLEGILDLKADHSKKSFEAISRILKEVGWVRE